MPRLTRRATLASLLAGGAGLAGPTEAAETLARITFVLVNDVYQMDEDSRGRGGLPRLATVLKGERARAAAEGRRLIFAHAGDTLSPSLMSSFDQGAHMVALFSSLDLDLFVPGNHEFDFGRAVYERRMSEGGFTVLAANLRDAQGLPLARHRDEIAYDVNGLKLVVIGSAFDASAALSHIDDLVFAPTVDVVRDKAKAARAAGADFVVALVHADKPTGTFLMNAHDVDLVLSGHNHDLHVDYDGRVALLESAQDADYVIAVDLDVSVSVDDAGRRSVNWWPNVRIFESSKMVPDADMLAKVRAIQTRLATSLDVELATLAAPLDSRTEVVRSEETAIGNLCADAVRDAADADIVILNGGGIRGNKIYATGTKLTRRDVLAELPFGNKTVVTQVHGRNIIAALENGFSRLGRPNGRFPQVSGLIVQARASATSGARVKSVSVAGAPLDLDRIYKLATSDFMARGGDGYAMLAGRTRVTADSGDALVAQDVMAYVQARGTIAEKVEGRIVIV